MKRGEVLLIDDNVAELRLFDLAFEATGYPRHLKTFNDPEKAYEYIVDHAQNVFIIICDINMPGMTGPELLERINQNHHLRMLSVPFIFFSNSDIASDIEHAYSLSAQGYFRKPMTMEDNVRLLKLIIDYWTEARIPRDKHHYVHLPK